MKILILLSLVGIGKLILKYMDNKNNKIIQDINPYNDIFKDNN